MKYVNLEEQFHSFLTWDKMFDSEEELVKLAKKVDIKKYRARSCAFASKLVSIQVVLQKRKELTEKEMKELQNIAGEIYKYYNIEGVSY
ncbi:hypothetical protein [Bacillus toyonensis]|uniref:hypothetical protein n=1 Tax=Bacillus toyonensis TaxID=155322 RepID=UPI000BF52184|nr:hypothetical protein [Bacillus toyonensis]PGF04966.1 hypothetical protein COM61_00565 [Bacillus toyonensis]